MARNGAGLCIAVDVTPAREGGECGEARPFVLELLRGLATAPRPLQYLLLTAADNHAAFEPFERLGMARWRADGDEPLALRENGVDVLFCPMTEPTYAEPGVTTVSVVYDLRHLTCPWFFGAEELGHRTRLSERVRQAADHVVCTSEFSRVSLIRRLGVPPERTSTVPVAVPRRFPRPPPPLAWRRLAAYGVMPCRFGVYPANFWPHKNHRMLLMAFARATAEHPEWNLHLVLTGDPLGEGDRMRTAIDRLGLGSTVHLLGVVPDEDMAAVWSVASFLIFPSLFEGFGIPVVEAAHFDTPVICSREGGLPEVAGPEAIYVDAKNPASIMEAIVSVMRDPWGASVRARGARTRLSVYDPAAVRDRYLEVFERVARRGPGVPPAPRSWTERHADGSLVSPLEAYADFVDTARRGEVAAARIAALGAEVETLKQHLARSEADRAARLAVIERQGGELGRHSAELGRQRAELRAREAEVEGLRQQLARSEADRAARLAVIERQGAELGRHSAELGRQRAELRAREAEVEGLRQQLARSEADRAARLAVIERQGAELGRMPVLEAEIDMLRQHVAVSEADRAARLAVIERQGVELGRLPALEADIEFLKTRVLEGEAETALLRDWAHALERELAELRARDPELRDLLRVWRRKARSLVRARRDA